MGSTLTLCSFFSFISNISRKTYTRIHGSAQLPKHLMGNPQQADSGPGQPWLPQESSCPVILAKSPFWA